jgi:hypothetical protein
MDEAIRSWFARSGFDYDEFSKERWAIHRAHPDVTLDQYRCRLLHRFGQIVSRKLLVYLDLNYWLNLRNVALGRHSDNIYRQLFDFLSDQVSRGVIVCPLSFWIFQELLKQTDATTRRATAELIDKLSAGVAFMSHGEIIRQEILHCIRKVAPRYEEVPHWPIRECIWTRTLSFLGDRIPVWPNTIPQTDQLLVQKNWEDFYFFLPFLEAIQSLGNVARDALPDWYDVDSINERKKYVRKEHNSFKSMFLAELMHTIKENEQHWYETMAYLYFLESGKEEKIDSDTLTEDERRPARNLIWYAFKKGKITDELPSYHIPAALYAATSWNSTKQLTRNDVLDFYHSQIAIPHCDVFLTDSALKSLACSQQLRFDKIYNTQIIANSADALTHLNERIKLGLPSSNKPILQELFLGDTYARST